MQNEYKFNHENLSSFATIIDITASDNLLLEQASEIYDISLGEGYIPLEDLNHYAVDPKRFILIGASIDQTLLGVMLAHPLDEETISKYAHTFQEHNLPVPFSDFKVGLIKSVAVRPEYRHTGIGTKLTIESIFG